MPKPGPTRPNMIGAIGIPGDGFPQLFDVTTPELGNVLLALLIVVASWFLGKRLSQILGRPVARRFERPSITRVVLQSIRILVFVVALMIAAVLVGFSPSDILLSVTVFSAVLAVVLAPIVRRMINGLFVLADRPFEIGDMIEIVDTNTRGFVEDVTLRYTKLFTVDNTFLVVPNSEIIERDIVNFSAEDKRTRHELTVLVTYEGDLATARQLIEEAAADTTGVITGGPDIRIGSTRYSAKPRCFIAEFADHGALLRLRYWVTDPYHLPSVRSAIHERIWDKLEDAPVELAYPHSHLIFDETSGSLDVTLDDRSDRSDPL